jgi:DNA adenine methylase
MQAITFKQLNMKIQLKTPITYYGGKDSFFYSDPPYFNSNCGHYDGYSREDFDALLRLKSRLQGKFLLSSYDSDLLQQYVKEYGWHQVKIEQGVSVNKGYGGKKKIEVLTANYPI